MYGRTGATALALTNRYPASELIILEFPWVVGRAHIFCSPRTHHAPQLGAIHVHMRHHISVGNYARYAEGRLAAPHMAVEVKGVGPKIGEGP